MMTRQSVVDCTDNADETGDVKGFLFFFFVNEIGGQTNEIVQLEKKVYFLYSNEIQFIFF